MYTHINILSNCSRVGAVPKWNVWFRNLRLRRILLPDHPATLKGHKNSPKFLGKCLSQISKGLRVHVLVFLYLPVYLCIYLFVYLPSYLATHLFINLFIYPSI